MTAETILVVDDAREIREFLADVVLRPAGYRVLVAADGAAALELAAQERPALIVSDIKMPGLSGLDLARLVTERWPGLPVILITAEGSEAIAQQALRASVLDYFIKPFDPDELLGAVRRALARPAAPTDAERAPLAAVFNELEDGVIVVDEAGRELLLNQAARRLLGVESLAAAAAQPELAALLAGHLRAGEVVLADGRTLSALSAAIPTVGRAVVLHDVTHLKELDRLKSTVVTAFAYDLRSPLTAIMGYLSLLEQAGPLTEAQRGFASQVRAGVDAMSVLLTELLTLGRLDAGLETQLERVTAIELLTPVTAAARGRGLEVQIAPGLPVLLVNRPRLQQALAAVVAPAQGVTVAAENGHVAIVVRGLPALEAEDPRLALLRIVVDQHGGRLWLASAPTGGSILTLMLPAAGPGAV